MCVCACGWVNNIILCLLLGFMSACFKCRHVCDRLCDKWPMSVQSTGVLKLYL